MPGFRACSKEPPRLITGQRLRARANRRMAGARLDDRPLNYGAAMRSPEGVRSLPDLTAIDWAKEESKKADSVWFKSITAAAASAGGTSPLSRRANTASASQRRFSTVSTAGSAARSASSKPSSSWTEHVEAWRRRLVELLGDSEIERRSRDDR